jgi:hypothetical protein
MLQQQRDEQQQQQEQQEKERSMDRKKQKRNRFCLSFQKLSKETIKDIVMNQDQSLSGVDHKEPQQQQHHRYLLPSEPTMGELVGSKLTTTLNDSTRYSSTGNNNNIHDGNSVNLKQNEDSAVHRGRILFFLCLLIVATTLAIVFYFVLKTYETNLAVAQYQAIADRALDTALEIANRKRLGTITMASIAGSVNPSADQWPFVTIPGYETISTKYVPSLALHIPRLVFGSVSKQVEV